MSSENHSLTVQLYNRLHQSLNLSPADPSFAPTDPLDSTFLHDVLAYMDEIEAQSQSSFRSVDELYFNPSAFDAFCLEGGNQLLYQRLVAQILDFLHRLSADPSSHDEISMIDIGCGSGRALLPILAQYAGSKPLRVLGIEPSQAMVDDLLAKQKLAGLRENVSLEVRCASLQQYIHDSPSASRFHVAMATFSISSQSKEARMPLFQWIAGHADCFVMAEFDSQVPEVSTMEASRLLSVPRFSGIVARYVVGAREHHGTPNGPLIMRGFLFPAFLGNFRASPRFTFEQSQSDWIAELSQASWTKIEPQHCAPFWWDNCILFCSKN